MWQSRFIHELFVVDLRRGLGKGWMKMLLRSLSEYKQYDILSRWFSAWNVLLGSSMCMLAYCRVCSLTLCSFTFVEMRSEVESMNNRKSTNQDASAETAMEPVSDEAAQNDLDKALAYVEDQLGDLYSIAVFRKQIPTSHGFPILRPRWYAPRLLTLSFHMLEKCIWSVPIAEFSQAWVSRFVLTWDSTKPEAVGIRKGEGVPDKARFNQLCRHVSEMTEEPARVDYFEFLRMNRPVIRFARLHDLPTHEVSCQSDLYWMPGAWCYNHLPWSSLPRYCPCPSSWLWGIGWHHRTLRMWAQPIPVMHYPCVSVWTCGKHFKLVQVQTMLPLRQTFETELG